MALLTSEINFGWCRCKVWQAEGSDHIMEDVWFAKQISDHHLRIGVLDGVTSNRRTPSWGASSGGLLAARLAVDLLSSRTGQAVTDLLAQTNQLVREQFGQGLLYSDDYPQAGFAVVEARPDCADCWIGADCEVWAKSSNGWHRLADHDMLSAKARDAFEELRKDPLLLTDRLAWRDLNAQLLEDQANWVSTAIGRYPQIKIVADQTPVWEELVIASDGADLSQEAFLDLAQHLYTRAQKSMRDDICLVHLFRG